MLKIFQLILKWPDAIQISQTFSIRNQIAFRIAKVQNDIAGYKDFINKYPDAIVIPIAWQGIHELAYEQSAKENTSVSYLIPKTSDFK